MIVRINLDISTSTIQFYPSFSRRPFLAIRIPLQKSKSPFFGGFISSHSWLRQILPCHFPLKYSRAANHKQGKAYTSRLLPLFQ